MINLGFFFYYPHPRGQNVQYLVCVCVCARVCVSVCPYLWSVCVTKQATSHKLGNLRQLILYKTGKFLQASMAQVAFKFGNKKN